MPTHEYVILVNVIWAPLVYIWPFHSKAKSNTVQDVEDDDCPDGPVRPGLLRAGREKATQKEPQNCELCDGKIHPGNYLEDAIVLRPISVNVELGSIVIELKAYLVEKDQISFRHVPNVFESPVLEHLGDQGSVAKDTNLMPVSAVDDSR